MKYLITGANGFIGNAFCNYLMDKSIKENLNNQLLRYDLPNYNILGMNEINLEIPEMVVHFAAIADLNESLKNQDKNFDVNIRGTYEVAKFCIKYDIPLVNISTCCVYHSDDDVVDETTLPLTDEPYAASKMACEYILRGMPDLKYTILRIGTVYGPGMRKELFNYIALDKAMKHETININGDGSQERTYIYIDDLVEGVYQACIQFDKCNGEIINLCGFEKISVRKTIDMAAKITGQNYIPYKYGNRYGDFQKENISIEKAEKLLGWKPVVSYSEGMKRTLEWLKTSLT